MIIVGHVEVRKSHGQGLILPTCLVQSLTSEI